MRMSTLFEAVSNMASLLLFLSCVANITHTSVSPHTHLSWVRCCVATDTNHDDKKMSKVRFLDHVKFSFKRLPL